jgi:hypothetical protein
MGEARMSLADLLRLADWGPRQLVTAINARLSSQGRDRLRLDPTAGYAWVQRCFRPRPPIPDVAAAVLTERLGFPVTAAQLWPGRGESGGPRRSAADDLDGVTHIDDFVRELSQLSITAATPQSPITDASGADLTAAVLDQLRGAVLVARSRADHDFVLPEQVDLISSHVAALRRLDDRYGGGALSLRYVTAELRSVVDLVEYASYGPQVGERRRRSGSPKRRQANAERTILFCTPGSWAGRPPLLRPTATWPDSAASPKQPSACSSTADRLTCRPSRTTSLPSSSPLRRGKDWSSWPNGQRPTAADCCLRRSRRSAARSLC